MANYSRLNSSLSNDCFNCYTCLVAHTHSSTMLLLFDVWILSRLPLSRFHCQFFGNENKLQKKQRPNQRKALVKEKNQLDIVCLPSLCQTIPPLDLDKSIATTILYPVSVSTGAVPEINFVSFGQRLMLKIVAMGVNSCFH